jgi:hypothetical protein
MKSYTTLRNLGGSLTNNKEATNLTLLDQLINDSYRSICSSMDWYWLQQTTSMNRTGGTQTYALPYNFDKLVSVYVTVGSFQYAPTEITNRMQWDLLNQSTIIQSDYATHYFIANNQISFYPIPASTTSNAITVTFRQRVIDLSQADYTTGTVALTNGSTSVTGSGTSWTASMAGRWIQFTPSNTAANSGDNLWYLTSAFGSATSLTLSKAYGGATAGGSVSYTLGEMSLLPEAYQDLPVHRAAYIYFSSVQPETPRSQLFKNMYDEGYIRLLADQSNKTTSPVTDWGETRIPINPNLAPSSIG